MQTTLNQKEEEKKEEKSRYNDLFLVAIVQTPPRQHPKFKFSKSDASKKEAVHKHHSRPIIDHWFSSWRNFSEIISLDHNDSLRLCKRIP
jgi:hypothetical protein